MDILNRPQSRDEVHFGLMLGLLIVLVTWALFYLASLVLPYLGFEQGTFAYSLIIAILDLVFAFTSTVISIEIAHKHFYLANNRISIAVIFTIISVIAILLVNTFMFNGVISIIPFNHISGLVAMGLVYIFSITYLKKLF